MTKKFKLTLKDGSVVNYTKDKKKLQKVTKMLVSNQKNVRHQNVKKQSINNYLMERKFVGYVWLNIICMAE